MQFAEFLNEGFPAHLRILSPPTCVGFGTGASSLTRSFSRQFSASPFASVSRSSPSHLGLMGNGFACLPTYLLGRALPIARAPSFLCHSFAQTASASTGISTCCPSVTSFDLALGPDLPRADQLYSGNLRYSA